MRGTILRFCIVLLAGINISCQEKPPTTSPATGPSVAAPRLERSLASMPGMAVTRYNVRVRHRDDEIASPQMLLGNPSNATTDEANRNNYLMIKPYFALAYNNSKGEPSWVSWRVCAADLGTAPRKKTFASDETLPDGFNVITTSEYGGSGFDRGHMCPHSDRAATLDSSYVHSS